MENIEKLISDRIIKTIVDFENREEISSRWKVPILGFADAYDPIFNQLKTVAFEEHIMPNDILENAQTVVAYFLPFEDSISQSNIGGKFSSKEWAKHMLKPIFLFLK